MIRGLYTSGLGMTVQMQRLDVISNNLANVNTSGFKNDTAVVRSFSEELAKRVGESQSAFANLTGYNAIGQFTQGLFVDEVHTDFTSGSFTNTNGPLDVAIDGSGFFAVRHKEGAFAATRDGSFTLNNNNVLVTKEGYPVLSSGDAEIVLPNGNIVIDESGQIFVDGQMTARLKLLDYENPDELRKIGSGLYETYNGEDTSINFTGKVEQGFLENSNVNSVKEMVEMINVTRAYEANQRMVVTHDTMLGKAVTEIARK